MILMWHISTEPDVNAAKSRFIDFEIDKIITSCKLDISFVTFVQKFSSCAWKMNVSLKCFIPIDLWHVY